MVRLLPEVARIVRGDEKRHEVLRSRLATATVATAAMFAAGATLMYFLERHAKGSQVRTVGDAAFFTAVQLLTISSQLRNPVTAAGRIVDVCLELYALI